MSRSRWLVPLLVVLAFGGSFALRFAARQIVPQPPRGQGFDGSSGQDGGVGQERIVSLSPSITETLFALGLGEQVVGVTRYCVHPPEASSRAQVGGRLDPSFETMVALEPDVVIIRAEMAEERNRLEAFGMEVLVVDHRQVSTILESFTTISTRFGVPDNGRALISQTEELLEQGTPASPSAARPRVLLVVGRSYGSGSLSEVIIAGNDGFLSDLLDLAGGQNAYAGTVVAFPSVGAEGLLVMDPDVIIDLLDERTVRASSEEEILRDWHSLPQLRAVRQGRVHVLSGSHTTIPGPRFPLIVRDLARIIGRRAGGTEA